MADTKITLTIPEAGVDRVITAINALHRVPRTRNPEWISSMETPDIEKYTNDFTDKQWVKEWIRRVIIGKVKVYERNIAEAAINIQSDDTLLS